MANTAGICYSYIAENMNGVHNFSTDTIKAALYYDSASISPSTTVYTSTGEVANSGSYVAGGVVLTTTNPATVDTGVGIFTPTGVFVAAGFTATGFNCILLYNSSKGNKAISVHTFASQTISGGVFTLDMPVNAAATALIQLVNS